MDERYCVFDVEGDASDGGYHGCAIWSDEYQIWTTQRAHALELLRAHARDGYVLVAHNAEYDIACLLFPANELITVEYRAGRFNHARWQYGADGASVEIWDSLGLAGGLSVSDLGDAIRLPKYPTPDALSRRGTGDPRWFCLAHKRAECISCYSLRDSEIVWRYMTWYRDELGALGVPARRTLGAAATALWRGLTPDLPARLTSQRINLLAREAYTGGRVEAFKVGPVGGVRLYDVRSMYAHVMQGARFPDVDSMTYGACRCIEETYQHKLYRYVHVPQSGCKHVTEAFLDFTGVAHCTVTVPPCYVPPLPLLHNERIHYPVGTFTGVFTTPELQALVMMGGRVDAVFRFAVGAKNVNPFDAYVTTLYARRVELQDARDPREIVVKNLLAALYGRMGMKPNLEREAVRPLPKGTAFSDWRGWTPGRFAGQAALRKERTLYVPSDDANVLWAALICAYARLELLRYLQMAGAELVYCDTDSVLTLGELPPGPGGLGSLRCVGEYSEGLIIGPKLYQLEDWQGRVVTRARGIPREVQEQFIREGAASFYEPWSIRDALIAGETPGTWHLVTKRHHHGIAPRQPTLPVIPGVPPSLSDTVPVVFGVGETEPS